MFQLLKPTLEMEKEYLDYIAEWEKPGEAIVPSGSQLKGRTYEEFIRHLRFQETDAMYAQGFVPADLYVLTDESKKIYGAVQIRHELNDFLLDYGGHIGYGVRPSERRKGYAAKMLAEALKIAKEMGLKRVLFTCDKRNTGSVKTILKNGGVLENEVEHKDRITQRYWITL